MIITPRKLSLPVVGVYFPEGEVGYVYDHVKNDDATRYSQISLQEMVTKLYKEYGCIFEYIPFGDVFFYKEVDGSNSAELDIQFSQFPRVLDEKPN